MPTQPILRPSTIILFKIQKQLLAVYNYGLIKGIAAIIATTCQKLWQYRSVCNIEYEKYFNIFAIISQICLCCL